MICCKSIAMVLIWVLPAAAWAQSSLSEDTQFAIIQHLEELMDAGDPLHLDPIEPVLVEMRVWSGDAITGEIRKVPFEQTLLLWKDFGRIDARKPAFRPDGELAGIIINISKTRNREGYWNHIRDKVEILESDGEKPRQIAMSLDFERRRIMQMLSQGLLGPANKRWQHQSFAYDGKSWDSIWRASDGSRSMRVTGRGEEPRELLIDTISFRDEAAPEASDQWALGYECVEHRPVAWADAMMASEFVMYRDGAPINRIRIDSIEFITQDEFELAVQTPDPESGRLPADVSQVVSSRGLSTTTWVQGEQGQLNSKSKLNYGELVVRVAVVLSGVVGVVLAIVWWRRRASI